MKIAQVSPVFERVPPKGYGGTERVISYLTEELVCQGHDVTLFATGDSITDARLVSPVNESRRFDMSKQDWLIYQCIMLDQVIAMSKEFDIIHFHTNCLHLPGARNLDVPHITTLHGRLDLPELVPFFHHFRRAPMISISDSQRAPLPWVNWQNTLYHGLPRSLYDFNPRGGDYFVFLGRISPEKRLDRAIDIALNAGIPLRIAAKIDAGDQNYFHTFIKPLLDHPLIEYLGEIGEKEKRVLLGGAKALLFPIDWPEPFGLVMIESFACGTPVIAYRHGAVPEVMEDGVTGFVVSDQAQAREAAKNIDQIDRTRCRQVYERRFTVEVMAENHLNVYQRMQRYDQILAGESHG